MIPFFLHIRSPYSVFRIIYCFNPGPIIFWDTVLFILIYTLRTLSAAGTTRLKDGWITSEDL